MLSPRRKRVRCPTPSAIGKSQQVNLSESHQEPINQDPSVVSDAEPQTIETDENDRAVPEHPEDVVDIGSETVEDWHVAAKEAELSL
ncbi:hypothetical protein K505DRAFT_325693 [Melanomma pulvis-pyrius CBS 109.77]|uniref:Uncharacterized protein n=1 Tax=Melanomma pulvis-pyrius CBS 109.77 TaxID=1314802 RepID=A0A6A6X9L4_9PLEO|nr:hypothetical protein K505DRAFT_325693 [Melanomma pulvis-pyrius CBS 109.77]